jgi:antirestriction protein ArdC
MKPLEPPIIRLSGIHGSCSCAGFYSSKTNEILLTCGLRFVDEDEAEYYIQTLNHELAHWAALMFLSPVERTQVLREYDICSNGGQAEPWDLLLEVIAYYPTGHWHIGGSF